MPNRSTALTAAAGEHFVAFKLSAMCYPVAMTRGGSPTVDLMVGDLNGHAAVSIQVKTSSGARREFKKNKANNHWEWDVGRKALDLKGDSIFYTFVDLKWNPDATPDVFIVPSKVVAARLKPEYKRFMFWLMDAEADQYREKWEFITARLNSGSKTAS
jgi:hypothetical protein